MRAIVTSSMAAMLIIQSLTGWCCHGSRHVLQTRTCAAARYSVAGCCERCNKNSDTAPQPIPCQCYECLGVCTYLPPEKTQLDDSRLDQRFDLVAIAPVLNHTHLVCAPRWLLAAESVPPEPPLRLHLLHRSLLI
jgi:hypothetical protein